MKSRKQIRDIIIEELLNDDAMFAKYDSPGQSNQALVKKMISHNEKDMLHPEEERSGSYMTHNQLFNICAQARYLMDNIPEGATIEPWMESKITTAQDALDSVYESLFARIENPR
jgi:hypothetical protein